MAVYPVFPGGKRKAFTLSYDDGWPQDEKLISLMNTYGIKGTFNLNSGNVLFKQIENPKARYKGHEVAVHGYTHGYLGRLAPQNASYEVFKDRETLENVFGGSVRGYAYAHGSYNPETEQLLRNCGIKYARTITTEGARFLLPDNWYFFNPSCEDLDPKLLEYTDKFLNLNPIFTQINLFSIYGHAHFTDRANNWRRLEEVFQKMGGNNEIWCATNIEICDYITGFQNLITSVDGSYIYNPTTTTYSLIHNNGDFVNKREIFEIKPGEELYLK